MTAHAERPSAAYADRCAVVGIGATDFSRESGRSELTLAVQAATAAAADAGLALDDIDGIVCCTSDNVSEITLAHALGISDLSYWGQVGPGGVAPPAMVGQAVAAVTAGLAETVLVFRSLNGRSGRRLGRGTKGATQSVVGGNSSFDELFVPFGLTTAGQFFAMLARRFMHDTGVTHEDLSRIAVACRAYAQENHRAQMHGRELTLEQAMDARMISDPLRLNDFCLETDGAAAVIVTTTERARDLAQKPAVVRAVAQSTGEQGQHGMMFGGLHRPDITRLSSRELAAKLYRRAGISPQKVDVAQFYDCFTITVALQLADYGLCAPGQEHDFLSSGGIDHGTGFPINTAGGHLSEGYIHGLNHVLEGVRQIRGTSTHQVEGAEVSLVTGAPPPGGSALLLVPDA